MREKDVYVIWTVYFDRRLSKKRGRKLPKNKAILKPTLDEMVEAAKKLGLEIVSVRKARYPACWWIESGYLTIRKPSDMNKTRIMEKMAYEMRRRRGG